MNHCTSLDRYALFGHTVAHSLSPRIHQLFARQTDQPLHYTAQSLPVEGFSRALSNFFATGGKGANVTAPFKQQAHHAVDQLTERAQQVGAVNTIVRLSDGRLLGDNSDGIGLVGDLQRERLLQPGQRILLIGAGGAARGILLPLLATHPRALLIVNRTAARAVQLAEKFSCYGAISVIHPQHLASLKAFDLIINATSVSAFAMPPIGWSPSLLQESTACYDLNYQKQPTPFLCWAREQGVHKLSDGLGMLVEQAAYAFQLWRQVMPDVAMVLSSLRREWQRP